MTEKQKIWYAKNRKRILAKQKQFRKDNPNIMKKRNKKYYDENKEEITKRNKKYREKPEIKQKKKQYDRINSKLKEKEIKAYQKEYREKPKNKEKANQYIKKYTKNRMKTDILFKLSKNLRTLIGNSFKCKEYKKETKTEKILGCTFSEFKLYIESLWEPWMNWTNKGNWNGYPKGINTHWDIDHIKPLSKANTEEDIIKLNHYSNLRPFCSFTNRVLKKGN